MKLGIINIAAQLTIVQTSTGCYPWSMCNNVAGHSPACIFGLSHPAEDLNQQACENSFVEKKYRFQVFNKGTSNIAALRSYQYPDTTIPVNDNGLAGILPKSSTFFDSDDPWEKVFKQLPNDTLSIFFLVQIRLKRMIGKG